MLASDVLRYHISKGGVGEVVEGKGFRHTVKAKTVVLYGKLECNVRGLVYELGGEIQCFILQLFLIKSGMLEKRRLFT